VTLTEGKEMLTDPVGTNDLTRRIIGCAIKVHRALGPGLLESAYSVCLAHELRAQQFSVETRKAVPLTYEGLQLDAIYWLDMLVNGLVIIELKAVESVAPVHRAQILTYLKLTKCPVGLLMNFNTLTMKDGIQRFVNPDARRFRQP
jgi:GxxExxY protein